MEIVKSIAMRCGQAYVVKLNDGSLLELGDVFLPNENQYGTRPYRFHDFGAVSDANKRVMTIGTMVGCCGACSFCSVRQTFRRKLTAPEIVGQVDFLIRAGSDFRRSADPRASREFHVLYSRMGEPSFNMPNVLDSIRTLSRRYPHVKIGLSTLGWRPGLDQLLDQIDLAKRIMLQFSAHGTDEIVRSRLLGVPTGAQLMSLAEVADFCRIFRGLNPRKVSLNFVLLQGVSYDFRSLRKFFRPEDVYIRLSPLNITDNSEQAGLSGLLRETDVLQKKPVSSGELREVIRNLEESGFAYAYAPAIDEEIRHQAACGQALETLRSKRLTTFEEQNLRLAENFRMEAAELQ